MAGFDLMAAACEGLAWMGKLMGCGSSGMGLGGASLCRLKCHRRAPCSLRHPWRTERPVSLTTITLDCVNMTAHPTSQSLPTLMRVCLKEGMT